MEALFLRLLNISITATYIILAVIFLRLLFRRVPKKIYCALWGIAGLRLVLPFSFKSVLSLIPSAETVPMNIIYQREPKINSGISFVNNSINPIISDRFAPNELASANPLQIWSFIASYIWMIGFAVMILYMTASYVHLRYKMRTATIYRDNIRQSDQIDSPFVLGLIKPKIYMPYSIATEDVDYVIAHEKAHIKRGDHLYKPFGFLLLSVYWFNPIIWIAYILLCRDIEMACDERVISEYGPKEKRSYSLALLNCSIKHHRISACPLAFGEVGIKERVKGVMNYKKPALLIIVISIIVSLALGIGFLTDPITEKSALDDISGNTYSVVGIEYDSKEYDRDAVTGFIVSERKELGLIIDTSPEFYLVLSMSMARPFSDSYLNEFKLNKENFVMLRQALYSTTARHPAK